MKMMLILSREEVHAEIPYAVICEARESARWNTGKRKRLWMELFTEPERKAAARLFGLARLWHLVRGAPNEVKMTVGTLRLWQKLGDFCATI